MESNGSNFLNESLAAFMLWFLLLCPLIGGYFLFFISGAPIRIDTILFTALFSYVGGLLSALLTGVAWVVSVNSVHYFRPYFFSDKPVSGLLMGSVMGLLYGMLFSMFTMSQPVVSQFTFAATISCGISGFMGARMLLNVYSEKT